MAERQRIAICARRFCHSAAPWLTRAENQTFAESRVSLQLAERMRIDRKACCIHAATCRYANLPAFRRTCASDAAGVHFAFLALHVPQAGLELLQLLIPILTFLL